MSLTYLTGISGTGKSSVLEQLSNRGFEAHGVDEEGYAVWVNKKTDQVESFEENDPNFNFHSWYQNHRWVLSKKRISELKQLSDRIQKPVILAGLADDEHDALSLFDNIIYLPLDKPTLKKRIMSRTDNSFGKKPEEMSAIMLWLTKNDAKYRSMSNHIIDASSPLESVVNEINSLLISQTELIS